MGKQQEEQLVNRIIARDEQALFVLYKEYRKPLYNFVARQISDTAVCEELVQDIFIDFLESLRDFRYQSSVKTFLFSIARNKVIDTIRKKKIKNVLFSALPSIVVESLAKVVMDDDLERKELQEKMKTVFEQLPHDYQVVLRLKYMEDTPVQLIAETLAMPFKATESLLFRARKAFIKMYRSLP